MLDSTSNALIPAMAEALSDLDEVAVLLVKIATGRGDDVRTQALVLDALTRVEHAMMSLKLEGPASPSV